MNTRTRFRIRSMLALTLGASSLALGAGIVTGHAPAGRGATATEAGVPQDTAHELSRAFRHASDIVRPSVVTVSSVRTLHAQPLGNGAQIAPNDPFGGLLRRFQFGFPDGGAEQGGLTQRGQGTGFIVDSDGLLLTNNHVVANADQLRVKLADGREFPANVVGTDAETDLALLRVHAKGLPAVQLGDSEAVQVGDWVIAVGVPFGLEQTVTAGIVSAKSRAHVGIAEYEDFLQTDAAINPGNSGGPLVDLDGRVIGVNTAIASTNGASAGIGFAIPVNLARHVFESLRDHGSVTRGWLGVAIQDLTQDLARSFGADADSGALVGDVVADGPAQKAGLERGDVVVEFMGRPIADSTALRNAVANAAPGADADVVVLRKGERKHLTVSLGTRASDGDATSPAGPASNLGLQIGPLPAEALSRMQASGATRQGAFVTAVQPGGAAESAGLRPGDLILEVDGTPVQDAPSFQDAIGRRDVKAGVRLLVRGLDQASTRYVFLKAD